MIPLLTTRQKKVMQPPIVELTSPFRTLGVIESDGVVGMHAQVHYCNRSSK